MKICSKCKTNHHKTDFYKDSKNKDGLCSNCRYCSIRYAAAWREANLERAKHNSRKSAAKWLTENRNKVTERASTWNRANKSRRSAINKHNKLKRKFGTVPWADREAIKSIYVFRDFIDYLTFGLIGYDVDHIIPLNGKTVCGLHVGNNLTVARSSYNRKKGNKFPLEGLDT